MTVELSGIGAAGPASDRQDAGAVPVADATALFALFENLIAAQASADSPTPDDAEASPDDANFSNDDGSPNAAVLADAPWTVAFPAARPASTSEQGLHPGDATGETPPASEDADDRAALPAAIPRFDPFVLEPTTAAPSPDLADLSGTIPPEEQFSAAREEWPVPQLAEEAAPVEESARPRTPAAPLEDRDALQSAHDDLIEQLHKIEELPVDAMLAAPIAAPALVPVPETVGNADAPLNAFDVSTSDVSTRVETASLADGAPRAGAPAALNTPPLDAPRQGEAPEAAPSLSNRDQPLFAEAIRPPRPRRCPRRSNRARRAHVHRCRLPMRSRPRRWKRQNHGRTRQPAAMRRAPSRHQDRSTHSRVRRPDGHVRHSEADDGRSGASPPGRARAGCVVRVERTGRDGGHNIDGRGALSGARNHSEHAAGERRTRPRADAASNRAGAGVASAHCVAKHPRPFWREAAATGRRTFAGADARVRR